MWGRNKGSGFVCGAVMCGEVTGQVCARVKLWCVGKEQSCDVWVRNKGSRFICGAVMCEAVMCGEGTGLWCVGEEQGQWICVWSCDVWRRNRGVVGNAESNYKVEAILVRTEAVDDNGSSASIGWSWCPVYAWHVVFWKFVYPGTK